MASLLQTSEAPTLDWLKDALQLALQLELFTLPPYLTARWSIINLQDPVAKSIKEIRGEEMLHFGIVANLIVAIGGTPRIADGNVVPAYPGPLPGNVRPQLQVALRRLDEAQAKVFMEIEFPEGGPIPLTEAVIYNSIGEFYDAIATAFQTLSPALDLARQLEGPMGLTKITTLQQVMDAINLIKLQGEGTSGTPEEVAGDLRIITGSRRSPRARRSSRTQMAAGASAWRLSRCPRYGRWPTFHLAVMPSSMFPTLRPGALIVQFDRAYSDMLRNLEWTWIHGGDDYFSAAVGLMAQMTAKGRQLMQRSKPDGSGNYGPCFRFVPAQS